MDTNNTDEKLSAIVQQINTETIARNHADATITGRLNALEKLVAEQGESLKESLKTAFGMAIERTARCQARIDDSVNGMIGLNNDFKALKEAQSVAALALEVSNIRSVLTQLLEALAEEEDLIDAALGETGLPDDLSALIAAHDERFPDNGHTLEQVKAAYLKIVRDDASDVILDMIERADVLIRRGENYMIRNTSVGGEWEIRADLVSDILAGEDE